MTCKHTLEIECEQIDHIVCSELKNNLESTLQYIEDVKATGKGFVYSLDAKEDVEQLEVLSYALAIVINYYGGFNAY